MNRKDAPPKAPPEKLWEHLHQQASSVGQEFYIDPKSGFLVATEMRLRKNGKCCESGCRHCPYGFQKQGADG